jgi:hypothetical protein
MISIYELDDSILTITANEFPISIAGLIESKNVAYRKYKNTFN